MQSVRNKYPSSPALLDGMRRCSRKSLSDEHELENIELVIAAPECGAKIASEENCEVGNDEESADSENQGGLGRWKNVKYWKIVSAVGAPLPRRAPPTAAAQVVASLLLGAYNSFLIAALVINFQRAAPLLWTSLLIALLALYFNTTDYWQPLVCAKVLAPMRSKMRSIRVDRRRVLLMKCGMAAAAAGAWATTLAVAVQPAVEQLVSMAGVAAVLATLYATSKHRRHVTWRPVVVGLGLQFAIGLLLLRTDGGYRGFHVAGSLIVDFLSYARHGADFLFGTLSTQHPFSFFFIVFPVLVFSSSVISVLYYLHVMQFVIKKIGWLMQITMGTTGPESLCCAANIFIGMTEAPLLIAPFLSKLTLSELHAVMTGGFATIAGGVLAAFTSMGIPPNYLICASVMNAPVALALSKLSYPETEPDRSVTVDELFRSKNDSEREPRNVLEAAAAGASSSIGLCANICVILLAFVAWVNFINATLGWFGGLVDYPQLSFQLVCAYLFMPVAVLMGVPWNECALFGELLGEKYFINEFVAYRKLTVWQSNRANCTAPYLSEHSETIATFALCSFANPVSMGVTLAGMGALAPQRRSDLAQLVVRAVLVGAAVTLVSASTAGLLQPLQRHRTPPGCLHSPPPLNVSSAINSTSFF